MGKRKQTTSVVLMKGNERKSGQCEEAGRQAGESGQRSRESQIRFSHPFTYSCHVCVEREERLEEGKAGVHPSRQSGWQRY
mmetsp:Transcript_48963/g.122708  ORF Transcript_48963/g.122708 Transcript_48963/m.122708 type:complete len:81 (-) Transcript_48963:306-548(-)